jgi:hypothetical protein
MSIRQWLSNSGNQRRSTRMQPKDLVAYYWTGAVSRPRPVYDIGLYGAHIVAPSGFYPGTVVEIIFEEQAAGLRNTGQANHLCVYGTVLRTVADGFCVEFVFDDASARRRFRQFLSGLKRRERDETNTEKDANAQGAGTD